MPYPGCTAYSGTSGEMSYGKLAQGQTMSRDTYPGHRWVVREAASRELTRTRTRTRARTRARTRTLSLSLSLTWWQSSRMSARKRRATERARAVSTPAEAGANTASTLPGQA